MNGRLDIHCTVTDRHPWLGAWRLSTALHLTNAGYLNITVFDKAAEIPSQYSAAYDLNTIVRPGYNDPFSTALASSSLALELSKQKYSGESPASASSNRGPCRTCN